MTYTIATTETQTAALAYASGDYQRAIILGTEALSGATLRGKARTYGGKYRRSREALLGRLRDAGFLVGEIREPHGKRVLCLAAPVAL